MYKRLIGLLGVAALVVTACGTPATTPAPTATPGGTGAPPPTAPPADQTLTMVVDGDLSGGLSNAADNVPTAEAAQFLYDAIYTYDASLTPVPNLATDEAEVTQEGKVWTVTLKEGVKFHDGTELTAADVVQTYQVAQSKNCRYNPSICLQSVLQLVEAVNDYTVRFTLIEPNATMATVYLPGIVIENKKVVDAAYDRFLADVRAVTRAEVNDLIAKIDAGEPSDALVAEAEAMIQKAGQEVPDKAPFTTDNVLDVPSYLAALKTVLSAIAATFEGGARVDALAAAYPYLDIQFNPVGLGSGPMKFVSFRTGESLEYERHTDYHRGTPQISRMFLPIIKDDLAGGQALVAGQVDWKYSLEGTTYNQISNDPNLQFVEYPDFGFFSLQFNLHPDAGHPWLDVKVRQATSYCFDKEATADAATDGQGIAVYSDIPPASWAFPASGLETYPFNPDRGKQLLEEAGWTVGADGIREKAGEKLATVAGVRAGRPNRSKWMQLMTDQVRQNCGIDMTFREVDFGALLNMLNIYPHINAADPGSGKPFAAYFGGWGTSLDPDPYSLYHSDNCSTAENPQTFNYICYANPEVDRLIEQGLRTFDTAERARIYQEYAILQSKDLPVIYAWSDIAREGLRKSVSTTEGPFPLDTPTFFWEFEKFTNIKQ